MRFTWDPHKRRANLAKHGLDFIHAERVFAGPMILIEDNRKNCEERRAAHAQQSPPSLRRSSVGVSGRRSSIR
jgi:uncharacterized DUF497 family protein